MKLLKATCGTMLALALAYGTAAFVTADFGWLRDIWQWERGDRAALLYGIICCVTFGSMAGAWLLSDNT